ncbi:hypothetical protein [Rhizobium anhuiense]|uniref:hypothetical protein n=1 Tax=Rhizobium anhuiense TaxID=1184720 RepID=UPI0020CFC7A3|nr:hypothetical protein [Rhizobium anhuiense]UTS88860.1 hypothetical protein NE851_07110 [Rhizobium anhuiense bv. trifolii]
MDAPAIRFGRDWSIPKYAREHGRDISRDVTGANMVDKSAKPVHSCTSPQKVWNFHQRIHVADLGIHFLGGHRDVAPDWCDSQRSGLNGDPLSVDGPYIPLDIEQRVDQFDGLQCHG